MRVCNNHGWHFREPFINKESIPQPYNQVLLIFIVYWRWELIHKEFESCTEGHSLKEQ